MKNLSFCWVLLVLSFHAGVKGINMSNINERLDISFLLLLYSCGEYLELGNFVSKAPLLIGQVLLKCLKPFFLYKLSARQVPFTLKEQKLADLLKPSMVWLGRWTGAGNWGDFFSWPSSYRLKFCGRISWSLVLVLFFFTSILVWFKSPV